LRGYLLIGAGVLLLSLSLAALWEDWRNSRRVTRFDEEWLSSSWERRGQPW
jgi:hypothetical protein